MKIYEEHIRVNIQMELTSLLESKISLKNISLDIKPGESR